MHGSWRLAAGFAVLFVAGCQSYPPPYGYGYQGNYPVPGGGTYVQPGATYMPQGTITSPATPSAIPPASSWQQPKNAAPNSGQLSGAASPASSAAGTNKLVPEYAEPDAAANTLGAPR